MNGKRIKMSKRLPSYFINESFYNSKKLFICIDDDVNEESHGEEEDPNDPEPINKQGIEDQERLCKFLMILVFFSKFGGSMLKSLKELNREELSHKKQSVITSFFSKQ